MPIDTETETYRTLLACAHRRTGSVPPELVAGHILAVTHGGDWPVQRDALEALLRRFASAQADEVQIVARPPRKRFLGLYTTRRRVPGAQSYRTLLRATLPIEGSCGCPDFLRSSLGLCKHLVGVLQDVASRRQGLENGGEPIPRAGPLRWDPVRPLTGVGDWLARVRWVDGQPDESLRRWFRRRSGSRRAGPPEETDGWTLDVPDRSRRRLALVESLLGVLRDGRGDPAVRALLQREHERLVREAFATGNPTSWCSTRPSGSRTGQRRPRSR